MEPLQDHNRDRYQLATRVVDEVWLHPIITGAAVIGVALAIDALWRYRPAQSRHGRSRIAERVRHYLG